MKLLFSSFNCDASDRKIINYKSFNCDNMDSNNTERDNISCDVIGCYYIDYSIVYCSTR